MNSATGISVALNVFRLRGRSVQEATETILKVPYSSFQHTQDLCKRFLSPECCNNLQSKLGNNIPEQNLYLEQECLKHQNGMAIGSCAEAKKRVDMCIINTYIDTGQRTSHTVQGTDMSPTPRPMPRKKEIQPEEIPHPGSPLPGMPIPAFPDVGIPIVPELPVPEVPEIPMPKEPGKIPKREGFPSQSSPYPGSHVQTCSTQVTQDTPKDL